MEGMEIFMGIFEFCFCYSGGLYKVDCYSVVCFSFILSLNISEIMVLMCWVYFF